MTTYAYRDDTGEILAVWDTGFGARTVRVSAVADPEHGLRLAGTLTSLSEAVWRLYVQPPTAQGDPGEVNTAAWRRQHALDAFERLPQLLRDPNLPHGSGLLVSLVPTDEAGHRVGRVLHAIGDQVVTEDVVAEVEREVQAVGHADLGDFRGRAQQATVLSRLELSPTQAQAAWDILTAGALEVGAGLVGVFDPTAASVAAAAWLRGAAEVAGESTGVSWTEVVLRADDIEALPVETPTAVLDALAVGSTPTEVVLGLVSDALAVARGEVPSTGEDLAADIAEVAARAHHGRGAVAGDFSALRLTPLDPQRPALDLLEDLMWGIWGCFLWWREENWDVLDDAADDDADGPADELDDDDAGDGEDADAGALEQTFLDLLNGHMSVANRDML